MRYIVETVTAETILNDPETSEWLKRALREALSSRDPFEAANEAELFVAALRTEARRALELNRQWQSFGL